VRVTVRNLKQATIKHFITPLIVEQVAIENKISKSFQLEIQKKKFIYKAAEQRFYTIDYPTQDLIGDYQEAEGIQNEQTLKKMDLVYGPNKMSIPIPDFFDLYKEHMVAPFFVF
jgi:cation-transporting ATPase 13A1